MDRFLVSSEAGSWFHNALQKAELKLVSDYIPIVLSFGHLSSRPTPFRFFNIWCVDQEFQTLVPNVWRELESRPSSLWGKFNHLRVRVRVGNAPNMLPRLQGVTNVSMS